MGEALFYTAWGTLGSSCQKVSHKEINLVTVPGMPISVLCLASTDAFHWRIVLPLASCKFLAPWYNDQKITIKDGESSNA